VNTAVSSMTSTSDIKFQPGALRSPDVLNGPEFGLLSGAVSPSQAGGLYAITDSVTITLNLSGTITGDLLGFIDSQAVVLSFASPNTVPEGGSTAILLGLALLGFGGLRRKLQK